jgi:hypothetical protein
MKNTKIDYSKTNYISKISMRYLLMQLCVLAVRYFQRKYKKISLKNRYNQTNQVLANLMMIQAILYYFKQQFEAWGYFHPCCVWSNADQQYYDKLFPQKDFEELSIVIKHNPEAVTYYTNMIFQLSKHASPHYETAIPKQLKKWGKWN